MVSELSKRIISGTCITVAALVALFASHWVFLALVVIAALLMYSEWLALTEEFPLANRVGGLFYVGIPVWSIIVLRGMQWPESSPAVTSPYYVLFVILVVAITDIGAYITGKSIGKHMLARRISPSKTWEGAAGGFIASLAVGLLYSLTIPSHMNLTQGVVFAGILSITSQCGDLFESWIKRHAGVKDSGTLLPGHGGILDRVDGLVFAAPIYVLLLQLTAL